MPQGCMCIYTSIVPSLAMLCALGAGDAGRREPMRGSDESPLVLRMVRRGAETLAWRQRSVRLDVDVYVVAAEHEAPAVDSEPDTQPVAIELPVAHGSALSGRVLTPTLRRTDGAVGRRLRELARVRPEARRIVADADLAVALRADLLEEERALCARAERIDCAKPATREALFRRLLLSVDCIQSRFAEPLSVELLAAVSNLSPFHFARLFALVMGETPHSFLVRKRLAVARRLIGAGVSRGDAAERAGFGSRSTLFRHLREAA
jgi:AraC-like DNA-binding protein